nr:MAG TPA: ERF superfamily protein [Caudoviricetes sp.]
MNIYEKINKIQVELKATKDNRNKFGNYNYRSAEDIYNALKPFLKEDKLILLFDEKIRIENERELLTSTIEIIDVENPVEKITKSIDVIIAKPKNGNDLTQTTGVSISYARKYLMCGVFTIDNEKDNDAINKHEEKNNQKQPAKPKKTLTKEEKKARFIKYINEHYTDFKMKIDKFKLENSVKNIEELTYEKLEELAISIKDNIEQKKGA